jgi:hypothetical protein
MGDVLLLLANSEKLKLKHSAMSRREDHVHDIFKTRAKPTKAEEGSNEPVQRVTRVFDKGGTAVSAPARQASTMYPYKSYFPDAKKEADSSASSAKLVRQCSSCGILFQSHHTCPCQ